MRAYTLATITNVFLIILIGVSIYYTSSLWGMCGLLATQTCRNSRKEDSEDE